MLQPTPAFIATPQLQALLDAAVDGVMVIDLQGRIQAVNRAAERLFGYPAGEVLGSDLNGLMAESHRDTHRQYLTSHVNQRDPQPADRGREIEARRKDGSLFPAFLSLGHLEGAAPPLFVGFFHDLSPRRLAEQHTHRLQEQLALVARLATVGEMSTGIAHELNQPLTAVANYAQACDRLLVRPGADIEEIRGALQQITAQAVRAGDIIRRLRARARPELLRREPTDLNLLIADLDELIRLDARAHAVRYQFEPAATLPPVDVDRSQLQQAVLNLVRNAFEALEDIADEPREVTVRTRLLPEEEVEVGVFDNGPGLSCATATHLFEPFWTSKPRATGLGLAISRTIVRAHRGAVDYHANTPRGACFLVRLPVARQD